jgi:hypothetical protein
MAIALVQNVPASGTGTTNPTATISAATAGNLIVAVLMPALAVAAITDPAGYTRRKAQDNSVATSCCIHIEKIAAGGETSIAFTAAASNWDLEVTEWSGVAASGSEFDATVGAADPAAAVTSGQPGSLTPAATGELFIIGMGGNGQNGGSEAIDSGFTVLDAATFLRGICGYKIKTDALAENPTMSWTTGRRYGMAMTAYKPAVVVGGQPTIARFANIPHSIGAHAAGRRF